MAKIADVRLKWTPSPSPGVVSRTVKVDNAGEAVEFDVGPAAGSVEITVAPFGTVTFWTVVKTADGLEAVSGTFTRTYGDFEAPEPDVGLAAEIVAIREVE